MKPAETGRRYDQLAAWWRERHADSSYGLKQLERALGFAPDTGTALDVGCGSSGRFIERLIRQGFTTEGLDVSAEMIAEARKVHPDCTFHLGDVATWAFPRRYDFLSAWDSTFHLPLDLQEPALRNLCDALAPGGVLLFTFGGGDEPGEISGSFEGQAFDYSTLGEAGYLRILLDCDCICRHLEYDQPGEPHMYAIAQKPFGAR